PARTPWRRQRPTPTASAWPRASAGSTAASPSISPTCLRCSCRQSPPAPTPSPRGPTAPTPTSWPSPSGRGCRDRSVVREPEGHELREPHAHEEQTGRQREVAEEHEGGAEDEDAFPQLD